MGIPKFCRKTPIYHPIKQFKASDSHADNYYSEQIRDSFQIYYFTVKSFCFNKINW